jgi:hypothetical protein
MYLSHAQEQAEEIRNIKIAAGVVGFFCVIVGLVLLGKFLFRKWCKPKFSKDELAGEPSMKSVEVIPREESPTPAKTQSAGSVPSVLPVLSKHPAPFASPETGTVREPENVLAAKDPQQPHKRVRSFHRRRRLQDSLRRKLHRPVVPSSLRESFVDERVAPA